MKSTEIDTESLAKQIMGIEIEHENGQLSDNIAVMLASFFEHSICHPEDRTLDEYDCWTQWSVDQVNLIQDQIQQLIEKAINRGKNEANQPGVIPR